MCWAARIHVIPRPNVIYSTIMESKHDFGANAEGAPLDNC